MPWSLNGTFHRGGDGRGTDLELLTLAGAQRQGLVPGARVGVRLEPGRVHVMPLRTLESLLTPD